MSTGLEARCDYGGLTLTCADDDTFGRLREFICAEPSVADAIGSRSAPRDFRFIRIVPPSREDCAPARLKGLELIAMIIAGGLNGLISVVGLITIARWLMAHF